MNNPISATAFYKLLSRACLDANRESWVSRKEGLLISSIDPERLHCVYLTPYSLGMNSPVLPRAHVNVDHSLEVPAQLRSRFCKAHPSCPIFKKLHLELTFANDEADSIASAIVKLLSAVEHGDPRPLSEILEVPPKRTAPANLWTVLADEVSENWYRANPPRCRE